MTEKRKVGRPSIELTDDQIVQVEALAATMTVEQMADFFGIGRTTMFALFNRNSEISERYKRGQAKAIGTVATALVNNARSGNVTAQIFYLKTRGGWRDPDRVEVTGKDGDAILVRTLADFYGGGDNGDEEEPQDE